jgi:hypothetical protein
MLLILLDYSLANLAWLLCRLVRDLASFGLGEDCPQVAGGGDTLQFWMVAANILNKQFGTADKGWSSSLGVGRGANNSSP